MSDWVATRRPGAILFILLAEFVILVLLFGLYVAGALAFTHIPLVIAEVLPLAVPWGGALGGVCSAIIGVTSHWKEFGSSTKSPQATKWNPWYLVRLPIGAAFGSVAALIVVLFLGTVGTTNTGAIDLSPTGSATLFVLAFIVGYQQDVFRKLVDRVVAVVLGTGKEDVAGDDFSLPDSLDFGTQKANTVTALALTIRNDGRSLLKLSRSQLVVTGDGFSITSTPAAIAAGETGDAEVTFAPTEAGDFSGSVTITARGKSKVVALTGKVAA